MIAAVKPIRTSPECAQTLPMLDSIRYALDDLGEAVRRRSVWIALASEDIGDAHRRSRLGPIWLLLSYLAFVAVMVLVIRRTSGVEHYVAYVAVGFLVYNFLSETLSESATVFVREESFISGTTLPLSVYVFRQTMRSMIRTGYAMVGAVGILLFSDVAVGWSWVSIVPALALIAATAPAVVILLGMLGVFLPDTRFLIAPAMRIGIFVTPIFWAPDGQDGVRGWLYLYNPLTHYLEIVRHPIVAGTVLPVSWLVTLALAACLWATALLVLGVNRRQIVFAL